MSRIFVNQIGVQEKSKNIDSRAQGAEQSADNYGAESNTNSSGVDGAFRRGGVELNIRVRESIMDLRFTMNNMQNFIENAAVTNTTLDRTRRESIEQLQRGVH